MARDRDPFLEAAHKMMDRLPVYLQHAAEYERLRRGDHLGSVI